MERVGFAPVMAGWRGQVAVLGIAACAATLLSPGRAQASWSCGAPLQPPCPASTAAAADGSLPVTTSLQPLPAPVRGAPLFARGAGGHLPSGFNTSIGPDSLTPAERATVMRGLGGTLVRLPVDWSYTQAQHDGPYDWRGSDAWYRTYVEAGVRPILEVLASPRWAVSSSSACPLQLSRGLQSQQQCLVGPAPAHVGDFATFAAAVARRYPLAAAIEIWNEPNHETYWQGRDPYAYATLAAAAVSAIKAQTPAMRVLVGALSDALDNGPQWTAMATFISVLRDRGVLALADGLSFHPYPGLPSEFAFTGAFDALNATLPAASDVRLVATEIGAPTSRFTAAQQRDTLVAEYRRLDSGDPTLPWSTAVDAVLFNTDLDPNEGYGFVDRTLIGTLAPRPVFCAMAAILGGNGMCRPAPVAASAQRTHRRRHRRVARRHPRRYPAMTIAVHAFSRNMPGRPARKATWAITAAGG
jgi:hypothetical protein